MVDSALECRFCYRGFTKGEHLKRHERRHTGAKPYVCKTCQRSFNRQDSLLRHEKLHSRSGIPPTPPVLTPDSENTALNTDVSPETLQYQASSVHDEPSLASLEADSDILIDFDAHLIWPDTEDLFQSITCTEAIDHFSVPAPPFFSPAIWESQEKTQRNAAVRNIHQQPRSIEDIPQGASQQALLDVGQMVSAQSMSVTTAIDPITTTSVFLDECLHMFFVKFIPTLPLLHRATFVFRDCIHPLLLKAIAIGSLYLGPKDAVSKGEALWKLAHTAITTSWQSLINHKGPYDSCSGVQLVLTAVLGQLYGSLSKNKAIRKSSQAFRNLGFFWARQCGLLGNQKPIDLPPPNAPAAERDHRWKMWVAGEVQQRAVLGLYMLDGLVALITGESTTQNHMSNQLQISCDDAAFLAETSEEWLRSIQRPQQSPSYCSVFRSLFNSSGILDWQGPNCSSYSFRVLLEGMQSVATVDNGEVIVGLPSRQETRNALARILDGINNITLFSQSERMELLLRWHSICLATSANTISLGTTICSRYGVKQDIWHAVETVDDTDMYSFPNTIFGRRSLLHAVAIQDLVEQLPRGRAHALYMPTALFAAAIIYATFALGGVARTKLPNTVDWRQVCAGDASQETDTLNYLEGSTVHFAGSQRNLLYDLNSMQKLFRCLATQWGIAFEMEAIIDQLLSKRTQPPVRSRRV